MIPSNDCFNLTESSEGCKLRAYRDTGGVLTIGYGHTGGVVENQVISQAVAETLLKHDMDYAVGVVNAHALPCTQGQFDALCDFVFNVGPTQFLSSHLFTYHKSGQYDKAAAEFPKWKYDNGKVEPGLVTRRAKEQALYIHQGPSIDHLHTDAPVHSAAPVVDSALPDQSPSVAPPSPVLPAPASNTAPVSDTSQSGFVPTALGLFRNLLGKMPLGK